MTGRLSKLASLALALAVVSSMAMSGLVVSSVAANHTETDEDTFTVRQDGQCYRVSSIGDGSETVESFYDYTGPFDYSSAGTLEYQENQVSNLFFHNGSEGYSLIFLHDKFAEGALYGSTITLELTGLPLGGEWAVQDDNYTINNESQDDNWERSGTQSKVNWFWGPNRTDGGAFRGIQSEPNINITLDPGFNEEADEWGDWVFSGSEEEKIDTWQLLDGDGSEVVELDKRTNVSVTNTPCDQTPPEASVTANKTTVTADETIEFDASNSTDDSGTIEEYHWDFDDDGTIDETTSSPTTTRAYANTGEYNATVTVVDPAGNADSANVSITVEDVDTEPPTAKLDAPDETVVNQSITLDASNSTDNEEIAEYRWDLNGNGTIDQTTQSATIDTSYESTGEYDASVTVVDTSGNEASASATINVTEQPDTEPPTAALDAPSEAVVGENIELNASASTDNEGIVEYRWDFNGNGTIDRSTTSATTDTSYASADEYNVSVTVVDAGDNADTANATIDVTEDTEPPTAALDAPSQTEVGQTITLDAGDSTDNVGIVEYKWDFDDDGTVDSTTTSPTANTSYANAGEYNATVTVADAAGNEDSANAIINVTEATDEEPPTAALDVPNQANVGDTVTLNASDSSDNEGIVEYKWDFTSDGTIDENTTSATTTTSYADTGDYDVTVTVVDAAGNEDSATDTISITDDTDTEPPEAALDAPSEALTGETITFDASGSTDNGEIVEYKWDFDGDEEIDQTTSSATVESSYATAGTYDATVTVRDAAGNEGTATATVTVTEPDDEDTEPPTAKLDAPSQTTVGTSITLDASGSTDNEGIVEYKWDFDGDNDVDRTTNSATTDFSYGSADEYTATVTVHDAAGNADTASTTIDVTADDSDDPVQPDPPDDPDTQPPTARLDAPSEAVAGQSITLDAGDSADDSGIVEYVWDFDGDDDIDRRTDVPAVTKSYDQTGDVTPTVTVVDAAGNTDTASAHITVRTPDTEPPNAKLDAPSEAIVGEQIKLDATASADARGIVEYSWDWDFDGDGDVDRRTEVPAVTHRYDQPGDYNPSVTVADAAGNTDTANSSLTVSASEPEPPADDDPTPPPFHGSPSSGDTPDDSSDDTDQSDDSSDDTDQSDDSSDDSQDTADQTVRSMPVLSVDPLQDTTQTVEAGEPVSFTVTVTNTRNTSVERGIVLATSGPGETGSTIRDSVQLNISAGGEQNVTLSTTLDEPGEHDVYIGNQSFTVTVTEPTNDSSQTPDDSTSDTPDDGTSDTSDDTSEDPPADDLSETTTETPTESSQDDTESSTETSETPSENGPGFGIFSVVLAMLLSFLALYRRR